MLSETLNTLRTRLVVNNISALDERNTSRVFVEPVLEAIGWNLSHLDEAVLGYSIKGLAQSSEIYFALNAGGVPLLLVDVRPVFSDLSKETALAKTFTTAKNSPARYLAISNGIDWRVYEKTPDKMNLVIVTSVRDDDNENKLTLLNKDAIREGLLERYVLDNPISVIEKEPVKSRGYQVSDSVHMGLESLRKQIVLNRDIKDQEISNSLIVQTVLSIFLDSISDFDYNEISNAVILHKRIIESFENHFSK